LFGNKNCGYFCKTSCWLGEINLRWDIVEEQTGERMMLFNSLGLNCGEFQEVMYWIIFEALLILNEFI
jgi:hypothetical protein